MFFNPGSPQSKMVWQILNIENNHYYRLEKNLMIVISLPGGGSLLQSFCGVFSRDPTGRPRALIRLKCRKFNPTSFVDFCHLYP